LFEALLLGLAVSADFGSAAPVILETKASISDKLGRKFETRGASGGSVEDGTFSDGFDKVSAGIFSDGVVGTAAVVLSLGAVSSVLEGFSGCGEDDVFKIIGTPPCPPPTITILELEDCAS